MVKDFCIFTGEEVDINSKNPVQPEKAMHINNVAKEIHKQIKGKPANLLRAGGTILEVRIAKKFDENYEKQDCENIKEVIEKMREEIGTIKTLSGLIPNTPFITFCYVGFIPVTVLSHGIFLYKKEALASLLD